MSKKVYIYRHAKSDWNAGYSHDHERPLAKRGVKAAKLIGKMLKKSEQLPELIITSTAVRAKQTIEISISEGGWKAELTEDEALYSSGYTEIFDIISSVNDKYSSVMLVGHEPKCSSLTSYLIGGGNIDFPTAGITMVDLPVEKWKNIQPGSGELRWMFRPSFFLK